MSLLQLLIQMQVVLRPLHHALLLLVLNMLLVNLIIMVDLFFVLAGLRMVRLEDSLKEALVLLDGVVIRFCREQLRWKSNHI